MHRPSVEIAMYTGLLISEHNTFSFLNKEKECNLVDETSFIFQGKFVFLCDPLLAATCASCLRTPFAQLSGPVYWPKERLCKKSCV